MHCRARLLARSPCACVCAYRADLGELLLFSVFFFPNIETNVAGIQLSLDRPPERPAARVFDYDSKEEPFELETKEEAPRQAPRAAGIL